jgi:hypothetical protein
MTSRNVFRTCYLSAPSADVDITTTVATGALATGGQQFVAIFARYLDNNNLYVGRLAFNTNQTLTLVVQRRVAGVQVDLASATVPGTHAVWRFFKIRFQVSGSTLRAKAWQDGTTEPANWQVTGTDTSLTQPGSVGVRTLLNTTNTNTLPVSAAYEDFTVADWQTFTVTRSVNGVAKSHSAGEAVNIANPAFTSL